MHPPSFYGAAPVPAAEYMAALTQDPYEAMQHGYEVATLRAESRRRLGLPIIRTSDDEGMLTPVEIRAGKTLDDRAG